MNFKGFLKRTGFALLVEEWDKTDKEKWKKQAYRRLFKNNWVSYILIINSLFFNAS